MNHESSSIKVFKQSGVIPWRMEKGRIEVLLITSRRGRRWIFPKGFIEPGLTPQESAAKEALEEAGVTGKVKSQSIGDFYYAKYGGQCHVLMYAMKVRGIKRVWPESDFRKREWLTVPQAMKRLTVKPWIQMLESFHLIKS